MFKILIADSLPEPILKRYNTLKGITIDNRAGISKDELAEVLPEYDGLVVRSRTKATADLIQRGQKLKVIGRAGAGVDNIDTEEATRRGIIVMNTPGGNTIAATEHTIALMLAALRNIPLANASMRGGKWDRKAYLGNELFEKTVGVVGLGKIGREVAKRLAAFGVRLIGYDPILTQEVANRLKIELMGFEDLMKQADIITVHVPRMKDTINMVNAKNLQLCKDGVIIVNCARGGIINEDDLIAALDSGKVATAAVDVYKSEPPEDWRLAEHPKAVATPHLGASTEEAQTKVADQILQQMIEYFEKDIALNAVNYISVNEKIQPIIAPYFKLARKMGALFSQVREGRLQEVAIRFYGDIIELPLEPIAAHLMTGALKARGKSNGGGNVDFINMVNALAVAREKGVEIEISKKRTPLKSRTNLIACDFTTREGIVHLEGTVYAKDIFRLTAFGKYDVDADLSRNMIIVENDDVPGIIGGVGTILANENINITHVSSGRVIEDKSAVNIFNVEGDYDRGLQDRLRSLSHVRNVQLIEF